MWFLEQSALDKIRLAIESGAFAMTAQNTELKAVASGASKILKVSGKEGVISLSGVLTNAPDMFAEWFGGGNVTYGDIRAAIATAEADDEVDEIVFDVDDGPGGEYPGMVETMEAVAAASKPTRTIVRNLAASAMYAIISQTGSIEASNPGARFGSIGVAIDTYVSKSAVSIASTEAPDKRPDLSTPEGQAVVRKELDPLHSLMASAIGKGRGTTEKLVNENFGRGAVLLAAQALKANMIDSVGASTKSRPKSTTATVGNEPASGNNEEARLMTLEELRTKHPDVYAAAVKFGADQEQSRVKAHLIGAEQSGDNVVAFAAIRDGSEVTSELMMTYAMAGIKRAEIKNREGDNPDPDIGGGDPAPVPTEEGALKTSVADAVASAFGGGVNV